jgi:phosphoesterase RecJ-like protein
MTIELSAEERASAVVAGSALLGARSVALTTHVNPDGDGLGSEVGLAHLLRARGVDVFIVNPTPTPARFAFLFEDLPGVDRTADAVKALRKADLICVLDIADAGRLGNLGRAVAERGVPVVCVDHHASPGTLPAGPATSTRRRRPPEN